MNLLEKAQNILKQPVCDHCLGRQFAQLLHGYTNEERGKLVRTAVAMAIDKGKEETKDDKREGIVNSLEMSNFAGFEFHNLDYKKIKQKKCVICSNIFDNLDKWIKKIENLSRKNQIRTFLVGTKLSFELVESEEALWERVGIDFCESIKAEISREIGKLVEKKLKLHYDIKTPDVNFIVNIAENRIDLEIKPIFIFGVYQKLKRGIPQTRWPSGKYKTSVEQIIAKPFMLASKAKRHKLHGLGREDIDARCLGWRPFVLELLEPKVRDLDLKKLSKKIAPVVRVNKMRFSSIAEVREIKETRVDKTYRITVNCSKEITNSDIRKLKGLKSIRQKTPQRVLHRRADKFRKREVKYVKIRKITSKKFLLEVRCEAGLYVKELVTGDNGRTQPSVTALLGTECTPKDLDVIKIYY